MRFSVLLLVLLAESVLPSLARCRYASHCQLYPEQRVPQEASETESSEITDICMHDLLNGPMLPLLTPTVVYAMHSPIVEASRPLTLT